MKSHTIYSAPLFILLACSSESFQSEETPCIPDEVQPCVDTNGNEGIQVCIEDGSAYGSCFVDDENSYVAGNAGSGGNSSVNGNAGSTNSSAGSSSGGEMNAGGNNSGGNDCQPKNCLTLAVEMANGDTSARACGVLDDGCGNLIDCGMGCGDFTPAFEPSTAWCNQETSLCEDRCEREWDSQCSSFSSAAGIGGSWAVTCTPSEPDINPINDMPYEECIYKDSGIWCCQ